MRDGTEHDTEEPSAPILAGLTFEEETEMLIALTARGFGQDPAVAVAMHAVLKKNAFAVFLAGSPTSTATPASSPSPSPAP